MKKAMVFFIVLLLLAVSFSACAQTHDIVWINSTSSDRVHLRQEDNADSKSIGLYYSGTHAVILEEGEDWSYVMIGTERGYVYNTLLSPETVPSKARLGTVISNGALNLRAHPSTDSTVIARLSEGEEIILLGETFDHWYLVESSEGYGYVMNSFVETKGYAPEKPAQAFVPTELLGKWYYSSGAGAWQTRITILPDGTFWGYYHDSDMGDTGASFPKGTVYECLFTGRFSQIAQVGECEYQMLVEGYHSLGVYGEERIINKVRTRTLASGGISEGNFFSLYLPGFPTEQMPENAQFQWRAYSSYTSPALSLLYNHTTQAGFIPD